MVVVVVVAPASPTTMSTSADTAPGRLASEPQRPTSARCTVCDPGAEKECVGEELTEGGASTGGIASEPARDGERPAEQPVELLLEEGCLAPHPHT